MGSTHNMTTDKLELIKSMIQAALKEDMLVSSQKVFLEILEVCGSEELEAKPKKTRKKKVKAEPVAEPTPEVPVITISCDASIKENPGGQSAAGIVIRIPDRQPVKLAMCTPGKTNNEAEYDAIYEGLSHVAHLQNGIKHEIVIYSDSQLVVNQLTGKFRISESQKELARRASIINQLASEITLTSGVGVRIEWRPRNSTPDLQEANYLAQDLLGVPRH